MLSFRLYHPLLFALHEQAEQLFLVSANSDKTPHHTHLQHAKISQKSETTGHHSYSQLAVRPHLPPPTTLFQLKLKKNLSVCYILSEVGEWSNVTTTSKLELMIHNYWITDLVSQNPFPWRSKILVCNHLKCVKIKLLAYFND